MKSLLVATLTLLALSVMSPVYAEEKTDDMNAKPLDGELLLPDDYDKSTEKKCMTVCDQWGEDCIINPKTGSRKCRRVCKSFTEECF